MGASLNTQIPVHIGCRPPALTVTREIVEGLSKRQSGMSTEAVMERMGVEDEFQTCGRGLRHTGCLSRC